MATPNSRRQRELARQQARISAAADARDRTRRRQRLAAVVVAAVVVLAGFGVYIGSTRSAGTPATTTTTEFPSGPTSSVLPNTGITPPPVAPGGTLTGATPCPAEDGSSPRITSFAQAPSMCIDTDHFYRAVISTTEGDISVQLDAGRTPNTVNDFVVLSRYHYYDGQPVTDITNRRSFTVGMSFTGETSMFDIPNEIAPAGQIFTPGAIAMVGTGGVGSPSRGRFLIATFELAANLDDSNTAFGTMLDGFDTLLAINALGSRSGQPTAVVTITGITITKSGQIPR